MVNEEKMTATKNDAYSALNRAMAAFSSYCIETEKYEGYECAYQEVLDNFKKACEENTEFSYWCFVTDTEESIEGAIEARDNHIKNH